MSESRSDLHIGSTISRVAGTPWRVVVHWHSDFGQLVPAGVEVRCYGVEGDDETSFWGGQEHPDHELPQLEAGERTRSASSDLLSKRILWGAVLGEHAANLSRMLAESATETRGLHAPSAETMDGLSRAAGGLTRATDDTYQLVAALYGQALAGPARSKPAVYVLQQLVEAHAYVLDEDNKSDRVKVRQWIGEARRRGYLPEATAKNTRRDPS